MSYHAWDRGGKLLRESWFFPLLLFLLSLKQSCFALFPTMCGNENRRIKSSEKEEEVRDEIGLWGG